MTPDSSRRYQGEVFEWNNEKHCGFVRPRGSKPRDPIVFVSASAFVDRRRQPQVGDIVTYQVSQALESPHTPRLRTRLRAHRVAFLGDEPPEPADQTPGWWWVLAVPYFLVEVFAGTKSPPLLLLPISTLAFSLISIGQYGWDKTAAGKGTWRIPERHLNIVAMLGGWPGALVSQQLFRHKTQKHSFQMKFRASVAFNLALTTAIIYFFSQNLRA